MHIKKHYIDYETTLGTTVLKNIVIKNGKKHNHNKISFNYLGPPTQADLNSRRSQYSHVFFTLFSCFSCGKFENPLLLVTYRNQVFLYFHFSLKSNKEKK